MSRNQGMHPSRGGWVGCQIDVFSRGWVMPGVTQVNPLEASGQSTELAMYAGLEIFTDRSLIDTSVVHSLLADTYWANGRTLEQTELSISNSTPFAVFDGSLLVGFARVISDRLTLAYLLDMYVIPERRGAGIGTLLLQTILNHTFFEGVDRWMLRTIDAKSLYSRFGFELVAEGDTLMVLDRTAKSNFG